MNQFLLHRIRYSNIDAMTNRHLILNDFKYKLSTIIRKDNDMKIQLQQSPMNSQGKKSEKNTD